MARHGIGRLRAGGSNDPDAAAWAAAVTAAGGTYSGATLNAMTTFVRSAKASGYWTKLNRINLFCGNQLTAALVPLKAGGGSATDTNVNFVAGDYSESTGITGNGTTKYLNTGLVASASLTLNDTHLAIYNRSSSTNAGSGQIGAHTDAANRMVMHSPFTDGIMYSNQYNSTDGAGAVNSGSAIGTPYGFDVATRTAANAHAIYRNGSMLNSNAGSGGTLPAFAFYVFAFNTAGVPANQANNTLAAYSIGSGLTAGDVTAYNTHMQAFQAALGRSV